jgi:hypothetical protein
MFKPDTDVGRNALPWPIELKSAETKRVAGGAPTLPLPPPNRAAPWPSPW